MERRALVFSCLLFGCLGPATQGGGPSGPEERLAIAWHWAGFKGAPRLPNDAATCARGSGEPWFDGFLGQDVELAGDAESGYVVDLDVPPAEALVPSGNGLITMGVLLAYLDGNGNHQIDPRDPDGSSPDQVLGTSSAWHARLWGFEAGDAASNAIYYAEGEIGELAGIEEGWQVLRVDHRDGSSDVLPISTPVPVRHSESAQVSTLHCRTYCFADLGNACPWGDDPSCLDDGAGGRDCTVCDGCTCSSVACP